MHPQYDFYYIYHIILSLDLQQKGIFCQKNLDIKYLQWYCVLLERQVSTMTTLENLYYGNIAPHEYEVERGSEYDVTAKLVIRHEQELSATLTEWQNAILQKIKDNHTELMNLGERDAFCLVSL